MSSPSTVHVQLGDRGYDIAIGPGSLKQLHPALTSMHRNGARNAFVVVDSGVPTRFLEAIERTCDAIGLKVNTATITPTESIKTIETYQDLLTQIASTGHSRVDPVIALGGGIVGDLAGFVAASYRRGVPIIQCPTTLLSMVDASVGGKTGFNLQISNADGSPKLLKNLVGAFWQPDLVIADIDVLDSLDARYRRSGLAECIKHGCIATGFNHPDLMDWMIANLDQVIAFEPQVISELVARNVALKASVVAADEREDTSKQGGRMLLNFGHTFGHAIETIAHLSPSKDDLTLAPLHHGEAIALGMVAACRAAESAHNLSPAVGDELVSLLDRIGLPSRVLGLPSNDELIERMGHDKKATAGSIRVIYPIQRGNCEVFTGADPSHLAAGFDSIRG